jgi:hypothetical protein
MYAENRRLERKIDIFSPLQDHNIHPKLLKDYSNFEQAGKFLEGTGSMVLDRANKIAYVALSPRSNE